MIDCAHSVLRAGTAQACGFRQWAETSSFTVSFPQMRV
jgi:hypothetical protein